MPHLKLTLDTIGDVTVADPNERFIRETEQIEQLGEALYDLIEQQHLKKIILDLSKVQLFSSAALGVMIAVRKKADEQKARVVICGLARELKEVFKIVGLDRMFEFHADRAKALNAYGVAS